MKKTGFTLAELLITLGVIGVVSALIAPAISNLMPDKDKMQVLKAYNSIQSVTSNLLDNEPIYYSNGSCIGLGCTDKSLLKDNNGNSVGPQTEGKNKYADWLSYSLTGNSNSTTSAFEIADNVNCEVNNSEISKMNGKDTFSANIKITLTKNNNTGNFTNNKKRPSDYEFTVDTYGNVHPKDALSQAYLENPLDMNNRKNDLKRALDILGNSTTEPN